jgi:hypothetical protein
MPELTKYIHTKPLIEKWLAAPVISDAEYDNGSLHVFELKETKERLAAPVISDAENDNGSLHVVELEKTKKKEKKSILRRILQI